MNKTDKIWPHHHILQVYHISRYFSLCYRILYAFKWPGSDGQCSVLLLLLLSHFSRVRLCATPETAAHQAPPSLGFSRQDYWSGLPFPSPMHESEKWKWSQSVMSNSLRPHGLQPTRLLRPWDFPGKSTGVGSHCLLLVHLYLHLGILGFLALLCHFFFLP